jgi:dTDP-4-amino-4,6-dideoxygalactose transaminase
MIGFVEDKRPDYGYIQELLQLSQKAVFWTNFAPVSLLLEQRIAELLDLDADRAVVACANGALALGALVNLYTFLAGRELRWLVSAYTFPCQVQGPLAAARVIDCDGEGNLDLEAVRRLPESDYDGIIVTHLFGQPADIDAWTALARAKDKHLLFDSAASFYSTYGEQPLGRFGDGEIFSFHHTKACGFGEGGCVVVPRQHEDTVRSLLNFGLYKGIDTGPLSMNGKLSDVAAAFIIDRLRTADRVREQHREQWHRVVAAAGEHGIRPLADAEPGFPWIAPLLSPRPLPLERLQNLPVVLRKYYRPLGEQAPVAQRLFEHNICVPCHEGMAALEDAQLAALFGALAE